MWGLWGHVINHQNQDILKSKAVLLRTSLRQPVSLGVPRGYGEGRHRHPILGGFPHLLPGLLLHIAYLYLGWSLSVNPP